MLKLLITDLDGSLVDTFDSNLRAYQKAFQSVGLALTERQYRECFGLRFERFMASMGISDRDVITSIQETKKRIYPNYFDALRLNKPLMELIQSFRIMGGKTAIASTARRENLMHVLEYLGIVNFFDLIFSGYDVANGKPAPDIYVRTMKEMGALPSETMIFEDSEVGIEAAKASGALCVRVTSEWFNE